MAGRSDLCFEDFCLSGVDGTLRRSDREIRLRPKNLAVLRYLAENAGRVVSKDELLEAMWPGIAVGDAVLKVSIRAIRETLGDDPASPRFIATLQRRGYRFVADVRVVQRTPGSAGAATTSTAPAIVVGRDRELSELRRADEEAAGGRTRLAFVAGEPGSGKTTLVEAFVAECAAQRPCVVLHGQCRQQFGAGEAYLPVLDALNDAARGEHADEIAAHLQRYAPSWLAQLPWLAREDATGAVASGSISRDRMLREAVELLRALARDRVVVLVLEDLHWSDPSTIDLVAALAQQRQLSHLLILATYRPGTAIATGHPVKLLRDHLEPRGLCHLVTPSPFDEQAAATYLERRLGSRVGSDLVALLWRQTEGHPLFLRSLVDHLIDRDVLLRSGDGWEIRGAAANAVKDVPESVRALIGEMVVDLDQEDRALVGAASVVGPVFTAAEVAAASGIDVAAVDERFHAMAAQRRIVQPARDDNAARPSEARYAFVHALHQAVLYQSLTPTRRQRLHLEFGRHLEAIAGDPGVLAHHFREALPGDLDRAVRYAIVAGERALSRCGHEEAIAHFTFALAHREASELSTPERLCQSLLALGIAQLRAARYEAARRTYREAAELARAAALPVLFARAAVGVGASHQSVGTVDAELIALLEEGIERLGEDEPSLRAMLLARLAYALYAAPDSIERRKALCQAARELTASETDPEPLLWVVQYTRWALWSPDDLAERLASSAELLQLAEASEASDRRALAHSSRLIDLLESGDGAGLDAQVAAFARLAEATRQPWYSWSVLRYRVLCALLRGEHALAEELLAETLELGQQLEHADVLPLYAAQLAFLRLQQGRASELIGSLEAIAAQAATPSWHCMLAFTYAATGDQSGVRRALVPLASTNHHLPRDYVWLVGMSFLSEVAVALRDQALARTCYERLRPHEGQLAVVSFGVACRGSVARYLGLLADLCGDRRTAEAHFENALAVHRQLGAAPWLAQTQADLAGLILRTPRPGRARRDKAARLLDEAFATAEHLGMPSLAEQARTLQIR